MFNWNKTIFNVNQLMFAIWQYFEFPVCLSLSAVHSTWKQRLWPYQTIVQSVLSHNNRTLQYFHLQHEKQMRITSDAPLSVTSGKSSYACFITQAVIRTLPDTITHCAELLIQLFSTYKSIRILTIHSPATSFLESVYRHPEYKLLNEVLKLWEQCATVQKKTLVLHAWHFPLSYMPPFSFQLSNIHLDTLIIHNFRQYYSFLFPLMLRSLHIHCSTTESFYSGAYWIHHFIQHLGNQNCRHYLKELYLYIPTYAIYDDDNETIHLDLYNFHVLEKLHLQFQRTDDVQTGTLLLHVQSLPSTFSHLIYPTSVQLHTVSNESLDMKNITLTQV